MKKHPRGFYADVNTMTLLVSPVFNRGLGKHTTTHYWAEASVYPSLSFLSLATFAIFDTGHIYRFHTAAVQQTSGN